MFLCPSCPKEFPTKLALSSHIKRVHSATVKCVHCSKIFTQGSYRNHLLRLSRRTGWICDHCDKELTASRNALISHIERFHGNAQKQLECKICHVRFRWSGELCRHKRKVHSKNASTKFVCDHCGNVYSTHCALSKHVVNVHLGRQFNCKFCDRKFGYGESLKSHVKKAHSRSFNNVECDICGRCYAGKDSIIKHIQFDHDGFARDVLVCDICEARFEEKGNCLTGHIKTHGAAWETFLCDHCGTKRKSKALILYLIKSVHLNPQFFCDHFMYTAKNREQLTLHIFKTHLAKSQTKTLCLECNGWFKHIRMHKLVHNGQRKIYVCDKCDKRFCGRQEIADHCAKEEKIWRPIECRICGKIFNSKASGRRHLVQHSRKRKWFWCDFCDKQFQKKISIMEHVGDYKKCKNCQFD